MPGAGRCILCAILSAALARHRIVASATAAIAVTILAKAAVRGDLGRAAIYFLAIAVSVAVIETLFRRRPAAPNVRVRGASVEVAFAAASFVIGMAWLWDRFVRGHQPAPGLGRVLWVAVGLGCVFNALLAIILLARRYSLQELGLRLTGAAPAPLVIAIFGATALTLGRSHVTWGEIVRDTNGDWMTIAGVALSAAVPEEFFRYVWQTRLGAWTNNRAAAWLAASTLWAVLHVPHDVAETHSIGQAVLGAIDIIPLGLLWGYLTHRTGSILPSILLHATNVWGLQNL